MGGGDMLNYNITGELFQNFVPSIYHFKHVLLPLLETRLWLARECWERKPKSRAITSESKESDIRDKW
jgi:hypothetical protein